MAITNYKTLKDSIVAWTKRTELGDVILSDIIQLTEMKIDNSDLRLQSEEDLKEAVLETNDPFIALPPRFKAIRDIRIYYNDKAYPLKWATPKTMQRIDKQGRPIYYTVTNTIELDRTPDLAYDIKIWYYQTLESLDPEDETSTNAILTKYPLIYLYGAIEEAFTYVLDEPRAAAYRQKFYASINMANEQENLGRYPAASAMKPPGATP